MSTRRMVRLIPEVDARLVRYAEVRGLKPEAIVAVAVESYLREQADLAIRLADARAAADKHCARRPDHG